MSFPWAKQYEPKLPLTRWLDERLPVPRLVYNAVGVPVAAGVLYPFAGILITPIWASAAMTFSSVSVITNALRLRRVEL